MTTQTQQQNNFFNLHTSGVGYLNNIREVKSQKGMPYLSCNIAAMTGETSNPEYRYFNVNVAGEQNERVIRLCKQAVDAKKKVVIAFTIGDLWADTFIYEKDSQYHKKGDVGVMLKGRLINIKSITVDGEKKWPKAENQQHNHSVQKSAPQYQSEPVGDADFDNTPPQYQERKRPAYRQKQAQQPVQRQYPADSF